MTRRHDRRRLATAASLAVLVLLAGALVTVVARPSPQTVSVAAQRPVVPLSVAAVREHEQVLGAALRRMQAKIAHADTVWGDIDLRDVFAFGVDSLWRKGIDGSGTAVAVLEGWNYPGMQQQLNQLDDQLGLPHTVVQTVYPTGPLPATCPAGMVKLGTYGSCDAWQGELRLDVEAVHLFAPYARIVVSATPADSEINGDASSQVAMPEIAKAMEYVSNHRLANVMSISDGSSETDYSRGAAEIHAQDPGEFTAAAAGIPITNATGDCGVVQNLTTATSQCGRTSPGPASATWADSPYVTAVGGVAPQYVRPCPPCVPAGNGGFVVDHIEGAGLSEMYARPSYQDSVAKVTGSWRRSLPDITMDSAFGTSEAAPQFAAVLALATQARGANVGPINGLLYGPLAERPTANGLVDVVHGNNTVKQVPGYRAAAGYDVVSGWGTVDAARFVPALADAAGGVVPGRAQAAAALAARRRTLALTPRPDAGRDTPVTVTSAGFLPDHPVRVSIDGRPLATVAADTSGAISYAFTPRQAGLSVGEHTLRVDSLLLRQSVSLHVTS